jgi:hypothetical protein
VKERTEVIMKETACNLNTLQVCKSGRSVDLLTEQKEAQNAPAC